MATEAGLDGAEEALAYILEGSLLLSDQLELYLVAAKIFDALETLRAQMASGEALSAQSGS